MNLRTYTQCLDTIIHEGELFLEDWLKTGKEANFHKPRLLCFRVNESKWSSISSSTTQYGFDRERTRVGH